MNITDEDMSMGFNLNRKKNNNIVRIRLSSWLSYMETLEMCLESEEEYRIYNEYLISLIGDVTFAI